MSRLDTTEIVAIDKLMTSHKNPRKIGREALDKLKEEILRDPKYMLSRPILANRVNGLLVVYAGNQRLLACKELGLTEVPVRIEDKIAKDILDRRMLGDNVNRGEFDAQMLADEFPDEVGFLAEVAEFSDVEMNVSAMNVEPEKKAKMQYLKLTFQLREDLNLFYELLDDLANRYPNTSVSQRLFLFLSQLKES